MFRNVISGSILGLRFLFLYLLVLTTIGHAADVPLARPIQAGLAPADAAAYMSVPEGFRVRLATGEPQIHQPVAFAIDHRGRLWVAEAYTYPIRAPEGEGRDKIVILEDQDRDGSFETRKVFAEGLNLVSGLEVGFGGVWVGAAPYLMFIPDRDGNDVPDEEPVVLLDGFGYQDTHETLNAFIWGPDGWLYGCHGVFTHSRVGKPGTPDDERVPMNAAVWRYHPTRHEFEIFSYGTSNPWGVDFNDHGHAFITACVIPHLWHVIQGARYHRQGGQHFNPYIYDDIKTIARHRHYAGDIRDHAWWGNEPDPPADTLAAGGGHAHCGAMIYLGDNWPSSYRDQIFMHNIHGNRINQDRLQRYGSGYVGDRAPDVLLANDKWFRGINLKYGPDGSVYLIDWYDPNACHRTNPEIWDRTNGRVYNLSYGDPPPITVNLASESDVELVQRHGHANEWYVRMARRILQERAARGKLDRRFVGAELWRIVQTPAAAPARLRALWTLHAIGELTPQQLTSLLADSDEYLRSWAIQLELEDQQVDSPTLARLEQLAHQDDSPLVRLYLASALQRLPMNDRWGIVAGLLSHAEDADDHNLPLMIWYAMESLVPADVTRALELAESTRIASVRAFVVRRAAADDASLAKLIEWLNSLDDIASQQLVLDQVLRALEGRVGVAMPSAWQAAYQRLTSSDHDLIRQRADQVAVLFGDERVYPKMRALVTDRGAAMAQRREALEILVRGRDQAAASSFHALLAEPELRAPAIRALANLDDPQTPTVLIAAYGKLTEPEKRDAIGTLTTRPEYAHALLEAIAHDTIPSADLHAYNVRQIESFQNQPLIERLREVWGEIRESSASKQEQIAQYQKLCGPDDLKQANLSNGRRIFAVTCANCHRLFGEGGDVGPEITGSNRANLDYILQNIVDPSAVLGNDYRMTILELADGRVFSGLIKQETDSGLTMRTLNDTVVIAKVDVEHRELSELSMMPEGLLDRMQPSEVRDLVAYLASPAQVPLSGTVAPIDADSGRVPGALEGESLKIIEKSAGTAHSQSMSGFPGDRWSGNDHLWWTGAKTDDQLSLEIPVEVEGMYRIELVLTRAPDYATVQVWLNDEPLGAEMDLYAPQVITTGVLEFEARRLTQGSHRLKLKITGANPQAAKAYMVGLDYVRLVKSE
jgi:putative membrane-bound dehydrogenase-like protein